MRQLLVGMVMRSMPRPADLKKIHNYYGLVFQNFNLFPHYSVLKNITDAPMRVQKRGKAEVMQKRESF